MSWLCISPSRRSTQPFSWPSSSVRSTTRITVAFWKRSFSSRISFAAVSSVKVLPEPCVCQTRPRVLVGSAQRATIGVDGAALVLAQDRFPRLAVLDVEQDPVLQRAQEVRALEERLHREAIGLVGRLLPARHVAAGGVPGDAVPVVEQVRDVEELRRADQLRRLDLVAAQLLDAALDGVAVLRVLVLDDADRHAVDDETSRRRGCPCGPAASASTPT